MAEIHHQVGVKASPEEVYKALTTLDGLSAWWARATGDTEIGGQLQFHFGQYGVTMRVEDARPWQKVVWRCDIDDGEWKDTGVCFDIVETEEQVLINFSHTRWHAYTEMYAHCSTKWAVFMLSLKDYLETGKGRPFPDDIQVNHDDS